MQMKHIDVFLEHVFLSLDKKEASCCAPWLLHDVHQAFANLYQSHQNSKQEKLT